MALECDVRLKGGSLPILDVSSRVGWLSVAGSRPRFLAARFRLFETSLRSLEVSQRVVSASGAISCQLLFLRYVWLTGCTGKDAEEKEYRS